MATVRKPNSVAARKTRMAISLRLATSNFLAARGEELIVLGVYTGGEANFKD
jgi:hypothetical protein